MRNGREWSFLGPKNAPFCSEKAILPNSLKRSAKRSEFAAFSRYKNRHFPVSHLKRSTKRPKITVFGPKKCAVLQRERQFATLCLFHAPTGGGGGGYTREIGTMWQIGVLAAERWVFLTKKWPFSAISHYVLSEKFSGRLRPNGWFCSRVVATPKNQEYTGIYSIRRAAAVLTPHTPKSRKMVPNLLRFHIKTPICHIVPRGNL